MLIYSSTFLNLVAHIHFTMQIRVNFILFIYFFFFSWKQDNENYMNVTFFKRYVLLTKAFEINQYVVNTLIKIAQIKDSDNVVSLNYFNVKKKLIVKCTTWLVEEFKKYIKEEMINF